jgi:type I restriction enzyme S subunit
VSVLSSTNVPCWLGSIADEWKPSRIRNIARLSPGYSNGQPQADERCTVVPMEFLSEQGHINSSLAQPFFDIRSGLTLFENGDVLFAKITPCMENGKGALVENLPTRYAFGSTEFHVLRPRPEMDGRFLYYYTFNPVFRAYAAQNMLGAAGQKRVSARFLKDTRIFMPQLGDQKRISAYLDFSCKIIDAAVASKRSQIQILDALALTIIHQVVTQGLKSDVRMMASGLDWLREIPAHWHVRQIKRMCTLVRGQFSHRPRNDPAFYDGPYPFVQTGDVTAAEKYIRSYSQTLNELGRSVSKQFPRGTLVMTIAANIGDVAILDFEACFPDSMIGMIPGPNAHIDYLFYLMRAMKGIMLRSAVLSTQLNLNYVRIGTNFAAFPPTDEQKSISEYLDAKQREIFSVQELLNKQIMALTEHRASLIHECVTGQRQITEKDVKHIEAHA